MAAGGHGLCTTSMAAAQKLSGVLVNCCCSASAAAAPFSTVPLTSSPAHLEAGTYRARMLFTLLASEVLLR